MCAPRWPLRAKARTLGFSASGKEGTGISRFPGGRGTPACGLFDLSVYSSPPLPIITHARAQLHAGAPGRAQSAQARWPGAAADCGSRRPTPALRSAQPSPRHHDATPNPARAPLPASASRGAAHALSPAGRGLCGVRLGPGG